MRAVLPALLAGCGPDICEQAAPSLVVGVGEEVFAPLTEGEPVPIAYGPQGGWHVFMALAATGLRSGARAEVFLTARDGDEVVGNQQSDEPFRCDAASATQRAAGIVLQFWRPVRTLGPEPVTVGASITLPDGDTLETTASMTLDGAVGDTGVF